MYMCVNLFQSPLASPPLSHGSVMMPLRRNPPSPVNKGKRNSAAASLSVRDKHSKSQRIMQV